MKTVFFELENWEKEYIQAQLALRSLGEVGEGEVLMIDGGLTEETILALGNLGAETEIISIFVDSVIDEKVFAHFPKLKLIATRSTGYDHIDLSACQARGVAVANVPSYGEDTVAEYTFALLLNLSRKVAESYDRIRETGSFSLDGLRGFDLKGKTLGVIGTGKIGRNVIEIATGFNMNIIAYDKFPNEEYAQKMNYKYLPFEEVLAQADIITLHVPYVPENHHLINADTIAKMKKGAYLLNTARGAIVDTEALLESLKSGHLAGAGLDVLEEEGVVKDELNFLTSAGHPGEHNLKTVLENHILIDLPNVIVTPHNAFNTWEALQRILNTTIENIRGFASGQPVNLVK
ncbi:MAG TPA: hydroxyacid dehydrogenase [Candidatus Paceibacterota bacterium]|nr:hydroxyacid dehydrogenase [Candidatus Paceibacterota bacterium]